MFILESQNSSTETVMMSLLSLSRESLQDCDWHQRRVWPGEAGWGQTASQHQLLSAEVSCYHQDHDNDKINSALGW